MTRSDNVMVYQGYPRCLSVSLLERPFQRAPNVVSQEPSDRLGDNPTPKVRIVPVEWQFTPSETRDMEMNPSNAFP